MVDKLFSEFPPILTSEWEEIIVKDLKGADYQKKLVWKTHEGFSVRPYYRAENLKDLTYRLVTDKKENNWNIHEGISCLNGDFSKANKEAKRLLTKGIESLGFYIDDSKPMTKEEFATLLDGIALDKVPVCFCGCRPRISEILKNFIKYTESLEIKKNSIKALFDFNPLLILTTQGSFCKDKAFKILAECVKEVSEYENIRVICVDAFTFNSCGSSSSQELAFALAQAAQYIREISKFGVSADQIVRKMTFSFSVGSTYFMEIAKFRAARILWKKMLQSFGAKECPMMIHATTSEWNQTVYDPYVNMLRATTESMSAAIAGVDTLEVVPFDFAYRVPTDFSNRIARNVQSILKEESHFGVVADPAAGSYYIENLTDLLADASWKLFQTVEEGGGYIARFEEGFIQNSIKEVSSSKDKALATRRETLLGTNQFPNFNEKADVCITKEIVSREIPTLMGMTMENNCSCNHEKMGEPLIPYRGAEEFEILRLATDRNPKEPKAFMLTFGNLAFCRARAQFSSNFFAVAGIRVIDNNRFATLQEGVSAAIEAKADIVVACSSDEEYAEAVPQIAELLGDKAILVVAGAPACQAELEAKGIKNFISVKSNILEILKDYQKQLRINTL